MPTISSIDYPEYIQRVNHKWSIILILIAFLLLTSHFSFIHSISPLEQAQMDYSFQLTKLSDAHQKFITSKATYQTYKTALAKNEAFSKTKDYFLQTHKVYLSYLFLVEERTNIFDWSLSTFKKNDAHTQIEKEAEYIKTSLEKAQNIQTLEEIQFNSSLLEDHINQALIPTVAKTLSTADVAQVEDSLGSFNLTSQKIDTYAKDKIKDSDRTLYQNWQSEVENIKNQLTLQIADYKKTLGAANINYFSNTNQSPIKTFKQNSQKTLDGAKNILYEILNFI